MTCAWVNNASHTKIWAQQHWITRRKQIWYHRKLIGLTHRSLSSAWWEVSSSFSLAASSRDSVASNFSSVICSFLFKLATSSSYYKKCDTKSYIAQNCDARRESSNIISNLNTDSLVTSNRVYDKVYTMRTQTIRKIEKKTYTRNRMIWLLISEVG